MTSADHINRLRAERETCIKMAARYSTPFAHSMTLFRRAERLQAAIEKEVNEVVMSVSTHYA